MRQCVDSASRVVPNRDMHGFKQTQHMHGVTDDTADTISTAGTDLALNSKQDTSSPACIQPQCPSSVSGVMVDAAIDCDKAQSGQLLHPEGATSSSAGNLLPAAGADLAYMHPQHAAFATQPAVNAQQLLHAPVGGLSDATAKPELEVAGYGGDTRWHMHTDAAMDNLQEDQQEKNAHSFAPISLPHNKERACSNDADLVLRLQCQPHAPGDTNQADPLASANLSGENSGNLLTGVDLAYPDEPLASADAIETGHIQWDLAEDELWMLPYLQFLLRDKSIEDAFSDSSSDLP